MSRIGIMGGTFDPIHNGHLRLARQAHAEYQLDEVWFMPSGHPPHKRDHKVTDPEMRCAMVRLAIAGEPYFRYSDFEVRRGGITYTAQTLTLLEAEFPEHQFFFIVGADSLHELEQWYHPAEVLEKATLLVAPRRYEEADCSLEERISYLTEKYQARIFRLHCGFMDIASEELREMAAGGKAICASIPGPVWEYIKQHHLYEPNDLSLRRTK